MNKANQSPFPFMKFLNDNPDPLNRNGKPLEEYTMEEVSKHNQPPSIWTVYKDKVYDITMYLNYHPGGVKILEQIYGKDCTNAYNQFHKYLNIDNFLSKFQIGTIKKNHK